MRWLAVSLIGTALLILVPPAASAQPRTPTGVPLNFYVVVLQRGFPTVTSLCIPPDCPARPIFTIGAIDPANCVVPGFATAEEAYQYVLQNAPFPGPWYTAQAPDPAHAYAMVLLENVLSYLPNAVPPFPLPDAEEQVAAAFSRACDPIMPSARAA